VSGILRDPDIAIGAGRRKRSGIRHGPFNFEPGARIAFHALSPLQTRWTYWPQWTDRTGRTDRALIALGALVSDRNGFDHHVGLDHIDFPDRAGFDRDVYVGATQVDVNRWAIGGR
jgi:hypothetical protein